MQSFQEHCTYLLPFCGAFVGLSQYFAEVLALDLHLVM